MSGQKSDTEETSKQKTAYEIVESDWSSDVCSSDLHFQGGSLCFSFFCLLVSSVSDFRPDTRGRWWTLFLGSLVQSCCGEGGTLQTNNTGMCLQCLSHTGPAPTHGTCALPAHTAQALGCSARNRPRLALGCVHLPGLSCSGSGTQVVLRGADSVGPAFCALPRSEQLR